MPPRRRSTTAPARRVRVAGLAPAASRIDAAPRPEPPDPTPADPAPADLPDERPARPMGSDERAARATDPAPRGRAVPVLAVAMAGCLALGVLFAVLNHAVRSTPAAQNTALADVGTTAEVSGQLGDAVETVYSYDFARLDENERAAREVITPGFAAEFEQLFGQVRELAPQQQAVVSATVTMSAVKSVSGDRAELLVFMDQQATRAAEGAEAQQVAAAGRLTVVGERIDGRWRIADVESR